MGRKSRRWIVPIALLLVVVLTAGQCDQEERSIADDSSTTLPEAEEPEPEEEASESGESSDDAEATDQDGEDQPEEDEPSEDESDPSVAGDAPRGSFEGELLLEDQQGDADFSGVYLLTFMDQSQAEAVIAPGGLDVVVDTVDPYLESVGELTAAGAAGEPIFVILSQQRPDGSSQSQFGRIVDLGPDFYALFAASVADEPFAEFAVAQLLFQRDEGVPVAVDFLGFNSGGSPETDILGGFEEGRNAFGWTGGTQENERRSPESLSPLPTQHGFDYIYRTEEPLFPSGSGSS